MTDHPTRIHKPDAWAVSITSKFQIFKLTLGRNEFTVVPTNIPYICRFPAPNDTFGVNTYRGNSFVKGKFDITPTSIPMFERERGDEMSSARWTAEGGAEFFGKEDHNEFWCINLKNPEAGIYLQANYPLAPGESVTIPNRTLERNVFIFEGSVEIEGVSKSAFSHLKLTQDKTYTITNTTQEPAFFLYFYEATKDEFIATLSDEVEDWKYRLIPILAEDEE